jgi:hypothetical protein
MDGQSFDRLSVVVHRLQEQASRRSAFRVMLGGSLIAAGALTANDAEAKKKNKKNKHKNKRYKGCRGYGGGCNSNRDCCNGGCRNGRCWYTGGGGGGGHNCGGGHCQNGWSCRNQNGVHVCVPNNYPTYCGGNNWYGGNFQCCNGIPNGACQFGGDCCGGAGLCCQSGWKCCGGRTCIPREWDCNDFYRQSASSDVGSEGQGRIPSAEPTRVDERDYITIDANA